ncbi:MAG: N-acetylmuramoyl-L-alanine amidase [Myxococcales bacterium]|nr:N-acetylmuramoyl-L-alanine amidase [Myxococcales bacterium]
MSAEDDVEDEADQGLEDGEDEADAAEETGHEATPVTPEEAGEARVAPSVDGDTTVNVLTPPTSILVTVRRDFPLRRGERLGEWRWSSADGSESQAPQQWQLPSSAGGTPTPELELEADDDRPMLGWGIGRPALGNPGDDGGQLTTDRAEVIGAEVRLLDESGAVLSSGACSGRNGECRLVTGRRSGVFTVEVVPEHAATTTAGPGMSSEHELLYRAFTVSVGLQDGLLVSVDDPYDPPRGQTRARVGNRHAWAPTTSHLPLSVKPEWWKDPGSAARRGGTATLGILVLHCTGGPRLGNALNRFFSRRGGSYTSAGANYILDVDGHLIKLTADDRTKVHAGIGRWGSEHDMINASLGVEIINPNTGDPDDYMARAQTPYTEEQYATVLRLAREIVAAYPGIGPRILGHCDVATGNAQGQSGVPADTYGNKRNWDPGLHFEWERLAAAGLGMVPGEHFDPATSYAGVFAAIPGLRLRDGDRDAHGRAPASYGGEARPQLPADADVIEQLQTDIRDIGYQLRITGRFDDRTIAAVDRFRRHFVRSGMTGAMQGDVDQTIAAKIKDVVDTLRPPPPAPTAATEAPAEPTPVPPSTP